MSFWREEKPAKDLPLDGPSDKGVPRGDKSPEGKPPELPHAYRWEYNPSPGEDMDAELHFTEDASGSSRVIPEFGDMDFENKKDRQFRFAVRMSVIEQNVSETVIERSRSYQPKLVRVDKKNRTWTFDVGKWQVKAQMTFPGNAKYLKKADIHLTCSCPFWQWQGPEHWGTQEDYLRDPPRGTASVPVIRDPGHQHAVCKHAYAVFQKMKDYVLVPPRKVASNGVVLEGRVKVSYEGLEYMVQSIIRRYLLEEGEDHAHI